MPERHNEANMRRVKIVKLIRCPMKSLPVSQSMCYRCKYKIYQNADDVGCNYPVEVKYG